MRVRDEICYGDDIIPLTKSVDQKSAKKEQIKRVRLVEKEYFETSLKLRMRKDPGE